jgi:protein-tyrosine phosphatase
LVHCAMGISRSSAITIAYLMKGEGMLFEDAQAMVKARRSIINPNAGFVAQLRSIESKLVGK